MARDHGICHVCKQPGSDRVDHVIPVAEGGADDVANKAPIHQVPCHVAKTAAEAERARRRNRGQP
jgi:5-methylcytosine-specific restriction endonuclease McrA